MNALLFAVTQAPTPFANSIAGVLVLSIVFIHLSWWAFWSIGHRAHDVTDSRTMKRIVKEAVDKALDKRGSSGT